MQITRIRKPTSLIVLVNYEKFYNIKELLKICAHGFYTSLVHEISTEFNLGMSTEELINLHKCSNKVISTQNFSSFNR